MASIEDKRRLIQDIDKDFYIEFVPEIESYIITHKGGHFQTIKHGDFTHKTLENIRRVVYINKNGDMARQIDENNEKIQKEAQREQDDMIEQAAKDVGRPLYNLLR